MANTPAEQHAARLATKLRQYLNFCACNASKLSTADEYETADSVSGSAASNPRLFACVPPPSSEATALTTAGRDNLRELETHTAAADPPVAAEAEPVRAGLLLLLLLLPAAAEPVRDQFAPGGLVVLALALLAAWSSGAFASGGLLKGAAALPAIRAELPSELVRERLLELLRSGGNSFSFFLLICGGLLRLPLNLPPLNLSPKNLAPAVLAKPPAIAKLAANDDAAEGGEAEGGAEEGEGDALILPLRGLSGLILPLRGRTGLMGRASREGPLSPVSPRGEQNPYPSILVPPTESACSNDSFSTVSLST